AAREPEFGFLATGVLPFAGPDRSQAHAQAEHGLDTEIARFDQHQRQLGGLLHDDVHALADARANERTTDVRTILVAVADDDSTHGRQRQYRREFRLAAGFQAHALTAVGDDLLHHPALLVDLDRIHRGVVAAVTEL